MFPAQPTLTRPPSPDQLDRMLRVTPSFAWVALAVLVALIFAALVWSVASTAPVRAEAHGILLSPEGVADITPAASGRVTGLLVAPGQRVQAGQMVATIDQPELQAELSRRHTERDKLTERRDQIRAFLDTEAAARGRLSVARTDVLRERVSSLRALEATMTELAGVQQELTDKGLATRDRLLAARRQLQEVRSQRTESENALTQIASEDEGSVVKAQRELLEVEMSLAGALRDGAYIEAEIARRSAVLAPNDGMVVELAVNVGEMAAVNLPLMRILPGKSGTDLVALLYVPAKGGRAVQIGMRAQVIPATARVQRDGFIEGEVIAVSPIAATPEGIARVLKNSTLVTQLTSDGAPVQVTVRLLPDPSTTSGYRWSSGKGPAAAIGTGTMADGYVVTDEIRLLALVIPQVEYVLSRIGL